LELLLVAWELLESSGLETSPQPINIIRVAKRDRALVKEIAFIIINIENSTEQGQNRLCKRVGSAEFALW
jgi:hypothetical protein